MGPHYDQHSDHVRRLVEAALEAADPYEAVRSRLALAQGGLQVEEHFIPIERGRLFLVAAGKAAVAMAAGAVAVLGQSVYRGVVVAKQPKDGAGRPDSRGKLPPQVACHYGSHPVPDERSIEATTAVLDLLAQTQADDLVLCLISGGTSALLTRPRLPLADWQALNQALLASGCAIGEFNSVRKQLDLVKGGGLARAAAPARCVALILSDVVGNHLDMIGSGPTVADPAGPAAAAAVLARYAIAQALPKVSWQRITAALDQATGADPLPEPTNLIIGDILRATRAAADAALEMGFDVTLLTAQLEGEAREVGRVAAALAKDAAPGKCLFMGGETTVTVTGQGSGGRNQEVALAAAISLAGQENVLVASFATDGEDGPTRAAGAIATGQTAARAATRGLDPQAYLARNDSYTFFEALGDLIVTGPTGTNVNDLVIMMKYQP